MKMLGAVQSSVRSDCNRLHRSHRSVPAAAAHRADSSTDTWRPEAPRPACWPRGTRGAGRTDGAQAAASSGSSLPRPDQHALAGCRGAAAWSAAALAAALLGPSGAAHAVDILSQGAAFIPGLIGDSPLREGFVSAFLLIFFSEIGDKTFFIAVLLALQQPRGLVFTGTFGALAVMTVISVALGRTLHQIDELIPDVGVPLDDVLAVALLIFFGVQTLRSAGSAGETAEEERGEAQEVVAAMSGGSGGGGAASAAAASMVASTFALVFAAEWGDKSFLATIALAAASDPTGVVLGAVAGHGAATVIAVLGGSFLGRYIDEKVVQYVGGSLFLVFAAATLFDIGRGMH